MTTFQDVIHYVSKLEARSKQICELDALIDAINARSFHRIEATDAEAVCDRIVNQWCIPYDVNVAVAAEFNEAKYKADGMPALGYRDYMSNYVNSHLIQLIKECRSRLGLGLADSKHAVETAIIQHADKVRSACTNKETP